VALAPTRRHWGRAAVDVALGWLLAAVAADLGVVLIAVNIGVVLLAVASGWPARTGSLLAQHLDSAPSWPCWRSHGTCSSVSTSGGPCQARGGR
jgi:hypothetical protein